MPLSPTFCATIALRCSPHTDHGAHLPCNPGAGTSDVQGNSPNLSPRSPNGSLSAKTQHKKVKGTKRFHLSVPFFRAFAVKENSPSPQPYCTAIVTVLDVVLPIMMITGTTLPGATPSGTKAFTW